MIARRRDGEIPLCSFPREFDITLELPLWGKLLPKLHTLHLESQRYQYRFAGAISSIRRLTTGADATAASFLHSKVAPDPPPPWLLGLLIQILIFVVVVVATDACYELN
jgi:hypothetical protein